jgi:hypothetical protein
MPCEARAVTINAVVQPKKAVVNIAEEALAHSKSIVVYRGMINPFKNYMEAEGFTVEAVYLQHYWRSPLEVLAITWAKGVDNISDDVMAVCVQYHLRYFDHVISSEEKDAAHEKWTPEMQRSILNK